MTIFDLEIVAFELFGELETKIFGVGADKGRVGIGQGELVGNAGVRCDGNNGEIGALSGHGGRSDTRGSLADDSISIDGFGETSGSTRDCIVDFGFFANWVMSDGSDAGMILGIEDNFLHGLDGLERVFAVCGFVGKHDGIGALDDSSSNVGYFGTGRLRIINHGGEHLSGDNTELGMGTAKGDEFALDDRYYFGTGFDGHVAAGDHDAIGSFDNFFERFFGFDGFFGLDFGDDFGGGAER